MFLWLQNKARLEHRSEGEAWTVFSKLTKTLSPTYMLFENMLLPCTHSVIWWSLSPAIWFDQVNTFAMTEGLLGYNLGFLPLGSQFQCTLSWEQHVLGPWRIRRIRRIRGAEAKAQWSVRCAPAVTKGRKPSWKWTLQTQRPSWCCVNQRLTIQLNPAWIIKPKIMSKTKNTF